MIALTQEVRGCLAEIGEALDDALLLVDQHGVVHLANRTARSLLDLSGDRVTLGPGGQWQSELLELLNRLPLGGAATEIHAAGSVPLVLDGYAAEQDGEFWGGIFVARSAAVPRREAEASRAAEFAHDVKNALHSLLLNIFMLRKWAISHPYVETQTLAKFDLVTNEIHRLNGLAEEFLPDARPRARRDTVRLPQLLGEVVNQMAGAAREAGVEIRTRVPVDLPPLQGDARLLREAFVALIESRLQALAPGAEIEIQAGAGDKYAFVVVSDGGVLPGGEAAEGRLGRTERGLGVTEWVVRRHGGSFEAFTAAGASTFLVRLPFSGTPPIAADPDLGLLREA